MQRASHAICNMLISRNKNISLIELFNCPLNPAERPCCCLMVCVCVCVCVLVCWCVCVFCVFMHVSSLLGREWFFLWVERDELVSMQARFVYNELIATCGYPLRNMLVCLCVLHESGRRTEVDWVTAIPTGFGLTLCVNNWLVAIAAVQLFDFYIIWSQELRIV